MILREIKIKFEPKKKLNNNIYIWYLSISKFSILTINQRWISHFVLLLRCNWVINVRCEYTYIRKTPQPAFHGKINRIWRLQSKPQCFSILYRLLLFERYMPGSKDTTETLFFFIKQNSCHEVEFKNINLPGDKNFHKIACFIYCYYHYYYYLFFYFFSPVHFASS